MFNDKSPFQNCFIHSIPPQEPGLLIQSGPGQVHHVYTVALVDLTVYKANITRSSKSLILK
jgi:hypothetical protein